MSVTPDGVIEAVGHGSMTVVDAGEAHCADDALGCHLSGLKVTYLQNGDRFDPARATAIVRPEKKPTEPGTQDYHGNLLITDIHGPAAVPWGVCFGLAENTSRRQIGVALRYSGSFGRGYRYTFTKTNRTQTYAGYVDHFYSYAAVDLQLDVLPILADLQAPEASLPVDLPATAAPFLSRRCRFCGILLTDGQHRLRPAEAITRAEMATALTQTLHLKDPRAPLPPMPDVPPPLRNMTTSLKCCPPA